MLFVHENDDISLLSSTEELLQCKSLREKNKFRKTHMHLINSGLFTPWWLRW